MLALTPLLLADHIARRVAGAPAYLSFDLDVVDPDILFRDYTYRTSVSLGLVEHFKRWWSNGMEIWSAAHRPQPHRWRSKSGLS